MRAGMGVELDPRDIIPLFTMRGNYCGEFHCSKSLFSDIEDKLVMENYKQTRFKIYTCSYCDSKFLQILGIRPALRAIS